MSTIIIRMIFCECYEWLLLMGEMSGFPKYCCKQIIFYKPIEYS